MENGFSLIELMICLAIVAILTMIAIPIYSSQMIAVKRVDGKSALLDFAAKLEQYYALHLTYASATIAENPETDVLSSFASPQNYYHLAFVEKTANTFVIEAIPQGQQAVDKCGRLRINQLGEKMIMGDSGIEGCW